MIIGLVGKTSSGKSTIAKELDTIGLHKIVTTTTRPPRKGEVDGVDYHFISESEFKRLQEEGAFIETTQYNVASGATWYYGTRKSDLETGTVIILNPDGLKAFRKKEIDMLVFYITCSEGVMRNRLKLRGDDPAEAERRIKADKIDFRGVAGLSDLTINNEGNMTARKVANIINKVYEECTK